MKTRLLPLCLTTTVLTLAAWLPANGQITIEGAPFKDVAANLARMANMNFIFDPRVQGEPVSVRWENLTAEQALDRLLSERGFTLVYSPATSVYRIVATNLNVKPVTADQIIGDTNKGTRLLIVLDDTTMELAVANVARQAGLEIEMDPKLTMPTRAADGKFVFPPKYTVSIRWADISAAQALAALLDNYDLKATKDDATGKVHITPKESSNAAASPPANK